MIAGKVVIPDFDAYTNLYSFVPLIELPYSAIHSPPVM
jgi:hypothetical protein